MEMKSTVFYPFYDPYRNGNILSMPAKVVISLVFGMGYILLQYLAMPKKAVFFDQSIWVLGTGCHHLYLHYSFVCDDHGLS